MAEQIGYFKYIKDAVTGFFFTVDETALLSSKASKTNPIFIGTERHGSGSIVTDLFGAVNGLDDTVAINITFTAQGNRYIGHVAEIFFALANESESARYSGIVRYALCSLNNVYSDDLTHDLIGGVTEAASVSSNVFTSTLTMPGSLTITNVSAYARVVSGYSDVYPTGMTLT